MIDIVLSHDSKDLIGFVFVNEAFKMDRKNVIKCKIRDSARDAAVQLFQVREADGTLQIMFAVLTFFDQLVEKTEETITRRVLAKGDVDWIAQGTIAQQTCDVVFDAVRVCCVRVGMHLTQFHSNVAFWASFYWNAVPCFALPCCFDSWIQL